MTVSPYLALAPMMAFSLAVVATAAYVLGRRRGQRETDQVAARRELRRAKAVIRELEGISQDVRRNLATHHTSILQFKERVSNLSQHEEAAAWKQLSDEAGRMLKPTMRLSSQIAHAYDEIRQQANLLMSFTEVRTDPLTGLNNRRALEETVRAMFAMKTRYQTPFAVALLDVDHFKQVNDDHGHLYGDRVLQQLGATLDECARETDVVARYGGEEFVVIMPETDLPGACIFADRLRGKIAKLLPITVSIGVAEVIDEDTEQSILSRADTALYSAKSAGRNCVFRHSGSHIDLVDPAVFLIRPVPNDDAEDEEQADALEADTELSESRS